MTASTPATATTRSTSASNLLHATVTVNGGNGTDTVNVNDQAVPTGYVYTITSTALPARLRRPDLPAIEGANRRRVGRTTPSASRARTAAVTLTLNAGRATTPSTSTARPGACRTAPSTPATATIRSTSATNLLHGTFMVNGGTGTDTVNVNDQAAPISYAYTINPTTVSKPGFAG